MTARDKGARAGSALGPMPVFWDGSPTRRDSASAAGTHSACVQPRSSGQGSLLASTGVLVPLTFPSSPSERLSRARQGRFHADGLFLPVAVATALGASRSEAGGRGSYLPGAHQGHRVHLIRHCSILGLRGAPRSYQMTGSARQSGRSQGCSAAHCS